MRKVFDAEDVLKVVTDGIKEKNKEFLNLSRDNVKAVQEYLDFDISEEDMKRKIESNLEAMCILHGKILMQEDIYSAVKDLTTYEVECEEES